jgi:spore maturation protein CgeB
VASLDELAEKVHFYLSHENKRQEIVDRAYRFVSKELTITKMVGRILAQARQVRASKEKTVIGSRS